MTKGKIIALIIAGVMLLYSICAIALYFVITYFAPEKDVEMTVNTGTLVNVTNENEKWIINVEYYSNHNNTGYEMLEVKFNYYMSETELNSDNPAIYSKGIQIIGNEEGSIKFNSKSYVKYDNFWNRLFGINGKIHREYSTKNSTFYYDTQNGFNFNSIEKLNSNDTFKISIGSDESAGNYLMKFLGESKLPVKDKVYETNVIESDIYETYNIDYFLCKMLAVCRQNSVGYGADGYSPLDLGNIFTYKKMVNNSYPEEWLTSEKLLNDKLIKNFTNYFTIRIRTHENGVTKASDSMFGMVQGKQDFEILSGALANNYFHGEQVITLTEKDFEYVYQDYQSYLIKFKKEIVDKIKNESQNSKVRIVLNNNVLLDNGIKLCTNTNFGTVFKDELYYSIASKIDKIIVQSTNNGNTSSREALI